MNIIAYSLMCYGITAVISFAMIALVLVINKVMSSDNNGDEQ